MRIEFDEQCSSCKGTGLYRGMAERDGYAVVCGKCKGSGKYHFIHEYEEFTGRKELEGITKVIEANPGIVVGGFLDFGGISYEQWKENGNFPPGTEMRNYTCPEWWYQTTDYKKKPDWDECLRAGMFSGCKYFNNKEKCWKRWDNENNSF